MTDQFDKAQEAEQEFREKALENQRALMQCEMPDEDEDGNRYCLNCGIEIPQARLEVQPQAVRCVRCQSRKER
ncbi:TraR/DksA C4-type zinc finger protein [Vibrio cincinnatiensis]|uniref:TraR/DksA C4-type zinc finger protein n=1 Tax=Vibrio cincinnatiensis TaxID=675 RepID=UPI001FA9887F|nr:TraR/DksA C4-type zinc finger protein [Vibrio cincinnatiensis]